MYQSAEAYPRTSQTTKIIFFVFKLTFLTIFAKSTKVAI